jgi:hypothetical protein
VECVGYGLEVAAMKGFEGAVMTGFEGAAIYEDAVCAVAV